MPPWPSPGALGSLLGGDLFELPRAARSSQNRHVPLRRLMPTLWGGPRRRLPGPARIRRTPKSTCATNRNKGARIRPGRKRSARLAPVRVEVAEHACGCQRVKAHRARTHRTADMIRRHRRCKSFGRSVVGPFRALAEPDPFRAEAGLRIGPVGQRNDRIERQHIRANRRARWGVGPGSGGGGATGGRFGILREHRARRHERRGGQPGGLQHGLSAIHLRSPFVVPDRGAACEDGRTRREHSNASKLGDRFA